MEASRRIEHSSLLGSRAPSPFRTKMTTREHDSGSTKPAASRLLPHFPARRAHPTAPSQPGSTVASREEHLPGVRARKAAGVSARTGQAQRQGRSGVDRLAELGKRGGPDCNAGLWEESNDVEGFESPRLAKIRAQVAKDEVLSYMHQRQRRNAASSHSQVQPMRGHAKAPEDPADDMGDGGDAASYYAQQSYLSGRSRGAQPLAEDDLTNSSADQSPTRHVKSYGSEPGANAGLPPSRSTHLVRADGLGGVPAGAHNGEAREPAAFSGRASFASMSMRSLTTAFAEGSLTDEAFEHFKRDVSARVIQAHWRKWSAWKAKLRREAEERILQQLLGDDSGLSLRLLLGGPACSGPVAASNSAAEEPSRMEVAISAALRSSNPESLAGKLQPPATAGLEEANSSSEMCTAPVAGMPAKARPPSAMESPVSPAVKVSRRPSTVGPAAASRARNEHILVSPPANAKRVTQAGRRQGWSETEGEAPAADDRLGDSNAPKEPVQPSKRHAGGHAVYTFMATPRKLAAMEAEAAARERPAEVRRLVGKPESNDDAGLDGNDGEAPAYYVMFRPSATARASDQLGETVSAPQCPPMLPQQLQPSLDADSHPAMASPALSAATGGGGAASVLGAASASQSPEDTLTSREQQQRPQKGASKNTAASQECLPDEDAGQQREAASRQHAAGTPHLDGGERHNGRTVRMLQRDISDQEPPQARAVDLQRSARSEALQRLKQQGGQRAALSGMGPAQPAAVQAAHASAGTSAPSQAPGAPCMDNSDEDGDPQAGRMDRGNEATTSGREGYQHQLRPRFISRARLLPEDFGQDSAQSVHDMESCNRRPSSRVQPDEKGSANQQGPTRQGLHENMEGEQHMQQQRRQPRRHTAQEEHPGRGHQPQQRRSERPSSSPRSTKGDAAAPNESSSRLTAPPPRDERVGTRLGNVERASEAVELAPGQVHISNDQHAPRQQQQRLPPARGSLYAGRHGDSTSSHGGSSDDDGGYATATRARTAAKRIAAASGVNVSGRGSPDGSAGGEERACNRQVGVAAGASRREDLVEDRQRWSRRPHNTAAPTPSVEQRADAPGTADPRRRKTDDDQPGQSGPWDVHKRWEPAVSGALAGATSSATYAAASAPTADTVPSVKYAGCSGAGCSEAALPAPQPASSPLPTMSLGTARGVRGGAGAQMQGNSADPRGAVDASLTAAKMTSILKYLDEVELQAEQEASCVAMAPALLVAEPSTAAAVAAVLLPGLACNSHTPRSGGAANRPPSTAAANQRTVTLSHPATAHSGASQAGLQPQTLGASSSARAGGRHRTSSQQQPAKSLAAHADDSYAEYDDDGAASVDALSAVSGLTNRPAFLAESVYENVRVKIHRLQDDVRQRDARIQDLTQEVESLQAAQRTCLLEADARLSELLAAQRAEYEAAVSRHLAFVDRLLADKEALNSRVEQISEQLKGADERQERAIAKLKEGWAAELRRQKDSWAAAEKQRREAWMASKASEIKDMTVKGLEGEVQKLLARHKAELSAAQQAAADEARRHLDTYVAQNEVVVRQLKERMAREAEEAVEKERAAAATRLREVSERYEQQLQTQRMRLVADADLRLEQMEQSRKEEKKRHEEAAAAAREAGEARQKEAEEDWRREKEALRKVHEKQIEALREQYETGQEGWRAAMAERARKEVAERVAAIREKLLQERNEEVQAVMTRLETEHAAAVQALKDDFRRREEAAGAKAAAALKEARRAEAKMAERFRNAGAALQAADERVAASDVTIQELRRELESKSTTIRWLEGQVSIAKEEAAARERDVRSLGVEKAAVAAEVAAAVARDKQQVEMRLAQAQQEIHDLKSRHSTEMAAVEARVRATLAKKDEVIAGLREQLAAVAAELQETQEVLRQQQEELGGELDGAGAVGGRGGDLYRGVNARRDGRH